MADGKGCTCHAKWIGECACGADWTPQELINLRGEVATLRTVLKMKDQTLSDVIAKMEEAVHENILWKERDEKLYERIDALEAELYRLKSECTCDAIGDGPCPVHFRENQLQDESIRLRNELAALKKDYAEIEDILGSDLNGYNVIKEQLDELKKDARICADHLDWLESKGILFDLEEPVKSAVIRVIEATKEES